MSIRVRSSRFTGTLFSGTVMSLLPVALALACGADPAGGAPGNYMGSNEPAPPPGANPPPDDTSPNEDPNPTELDPGDDLPPVVNEPPLRSSIWFTDDFESGTTANWDLTPGAGAAFAVVLEPGTTNQVLQYTAGSSTDNLIALITDAAWAATEANAGTTPLADYYVQARVRPQTNGTTSNKQLFLVARYQDAANWYLGGLNVQTDVAATQVEAGSRKAGTISRTVQGAREILQGTQGQADGQWYGVRFEVIGQALTVYFDGESIGSTVDADFAQGKIGLFTSNKSFLIDDIVVGDPAIKPVSLVLAPPTLLRTAEAETTPLQVDVRALTSDGTTPDTFTVVSDNNDIVSVAIAGTSVTLTPLIEGVVRITFSSGSDAKLSKCSRLPSRRPIAIRRAPSRAWLR